MGQAFDDSAGGAVGDGGHTAQVVVVQVAQAGTLGAAGHAGRACGQVATHHVRYTGDLQGEHHAACCKIVFVFGDAVGFDFFLVTYDGL